jgi:hypothetical protein
LERRCGFQNELLHGLSPCGSTSEVLTAKKSDVFGLAQNIVETSDYRFYARPTICQRGRSCQ